MCILPRSRSWTTANTQGRQVHRDWIDCGWGPINIACARYSYIAFHLPITALHKFKNLSGRPESKPAEKKRRKEKRYHCKTPIRLCCQGHKLKRKMLENKLLQQENHLDITLQINHSKAKYYAVYTLHQPCN